MRQTDQNQSKAYLGTGWAFPLQTTIQGNIRLSSAERNIEESIQIILKTTVGERVHRPEFGSRLSELSFAPIAIETLLYLRVYVKEALVKCEPRIFVEEVLADADHLRGRVNLTINYRLKESYEEGSLVYPFYLQPSEEVEQ